MKTEMPQRDFLTAPPLAACALAQTAERAALGAQALGQAATPGEPSAGQPFIGIQISPQTMLDEGIERSLDFIQDTAAINANHHWT